MDELDDVLNEPLAVGDLDELAAAVEWEAEQAQKTPEKRRSAGQETGIGHDQHLVTRTAGRRAYDLRGVPNAVRLVRPLPVPGETVHAIMGGDFHAWDLVPAIVELAACPFAELWIATLGFNLGNNGHLCRLIDQGRIQRATILCSDYFAKSDLSVFTESKAALEARGCRLVSSRNHAKVILLAPAGRKDRYVVEGSANLRSCNNLEQFALSNDHRLFDFHRSWIHQITNAC